MEKERRTERKRIIQDKKAELKEFLEAASTASEEAKKGSIFDLCVKLTRLGVKTTYREGFRKLVQPGEFSVKPVVESWLQEVGADSRLVKFLFLESAAQRLWEAWCPHLPLDSSLKNLYHEGYQALKDGYRKAALEAWSELSAQLEKRMALEPNQFSAASILPEYEKWNEDHRKLAAEQKTSAPT